MILTHIGKQDFVDGMRKLWESHVAFLHALVQFTDGGGHTPPLSLKAGPLEEGSPVALEIDNVPIGLDREVPENFPLLEFSKEGVVNDTLVDKVEVEELVYEFVVYELSKNSPCDHLEGEDRDEFLSFDNQFVVLLVPDDVGETRQGLEPFVGVTDHDGKELRGFLHSEVWVNMGSETSPVLIVFDTDTLAEDSAHVLSKPDIWDFEVDLGIAVVVSTDILGIGQNTSAKGFSRIHEYIFRRHSHFGDISTKYSIQRTVLLAIFGHHTGALRSGEVRKPYGGRLGRCTHP